MGYVGGDDMSKLIAITGVSSVGKTSIAYEVARKMNASVICGDKVQIIAGYPIITGASDRDKYRTGSFLYGASTTRMTRSAWRKAVSGIITAIGGDFVIDGLAWFYMREAISLGATIYRLNVNPDLLPSLFRKRLDKAISSGLLDEVRRGQRDENLIKESSIAEILSMYTRGETSLDEAKNRLIEHSVSRAAIKVKDSDNFARLFVEMDHSPEKREATISSILANEIRASMGYVGGDDMKESDNDVLKTVYYLLARADPTAADLMGAAKQAGDYIESRRPDLAKNVCSGVAGWAFPLFSRRDKE